MNQVMEFVFEPLRTVFLKFKEFLPNLVALVIVLAGGVVTALLVKSLSRRLLTVVKFDRWCDRMGLTAFLRKENVWGKPSETVSLTFFWVILILSLMMSLSTLQLAALDDLVTQFWLYLPRALSAVFILLVGHLVSGFVSRAVLLAAVNSGYPYSRLLAEAVRLLLTVIVLAMALEQLQLAPNIVMAAFSITFGGIVLALAIAFGVGGINVARRMMEGAEGAKGKGKSEGVAEGRDINHI